MWLLLLVHVKGLAVVFCTACSHCQCFKYSMVSGPLPLHDAVVTPLVTQTQRPVFVSLL